MRRGMSIFIQALGTERQQAEGQAFASPSRSKFDTNVLQLSLLPLGVRTVIYSQKKYSVFGISTKATSWSPTVLGVLW